MTEAIVHEPFEDSVKQVETKDCQPEYIVANFLSIYFQVKLVTWLDCKLQRGSASYLQSANKI